MRWTRVLMARCCWARCGEPHKGLCQCYQPKRMVRARECEAWEQNKAGDLRVQKRERKKA